MKIPPLITQGAQLTLAEARRYSRHVLVPEFATIGQERLKKAKVVCVGAGGLGSPILMYLAGAGVGTIGIVEFDSVEETNLARQIIHGQSDLGCSKAVSAKAKLREINPLIEVVLHEVRLDNSNAMEIFKLYDVVIDGSDNFATRYLVNDACVLLKKPCVWGSIYRFDGQASIFWSEYGPCYRCMHPVPAGDLPNCAEAGVLGVLCATIGSIQATEVIKLITGIGKPLIGSMINYDALESKFTTIEVLKDPQCRICSVNPIQTGLLNDYETVCGSSTNDEISVVELKRTMDSGEDFVLIDVREPHEFETGHISGSISIPLGNFSDADLVTTLPRNKPIILLCRSGKRSATALDLLKTAGFENAFNVRGGVIAWAQQIDSTCEVH